MANIIKKVRQVNHNLGQAEFELVLRGKRGRLILRANGIEQVVLGCGSSEETMLADLNNCHVSRTKKLKFENI